MGFDSGLPLHLQHFQLHPTDDFDMLRCVLVDTIHHFTDILEVVTDLLEELGPLLFSCCLRDQLRRCQQRTMLKNVDIPLTPSPLSSYTISTPLLSQTRSPVLIGCCRSLDEPNQDSPSASDAGEPNCPTDQQCEVRHVHMLKQHTPHRAPSLHC